MLMVKLGELAPHFPCWRKHAYASAEEADDHIASLYAVGRHRPEEGRLNRFECSYCGRWHVGHTQRTGKGWRSDFTALTTLAGPPLSSPTKGASSASIALSAPQAPCASPDSQTPFETPTAPISAPPVEGPRPPVVAGRKSEASADTPSMGASTDTAGACGQNPPNEAPSGQEQRHMAIKKQENLPVYLSTQGVATIKEVTRGAVDLWRKDGRLKPAGILLQGSKTGNHSTYLYAEEDVNNFIPPSKARAPRPAAEDPTTLVVRMSKLEGLVSRLVQTLVEKEETTSASPQRVPTQE